MFYRSHTGQSLILLIGKLGLRGKPGDSGSLLDGTWDLEILTHCSMCNCCLGNPAINEIPAEKQMRNESDLEYRFISSVNEADRF